MCALTVGTGPVAERSTLGTGRVKEEAEGAAGGGGLRETSD